VVIKNIVMIKINQLINLKKKVSNNLKINYLIKLNILYKSANKIYPLAKIYSSPAPSNKLMSPLDLKMIPSMIQIIMNRICLELLQNVVMPNLMLLTSMYFQLEVMIDFNISNKLDLK
jgi:hypothetical protein